MLIGEVFYLIFFSSFVEVGVGSIMKLLIFANVCRNPTLIYLYSFTLNRSYKWPLFNLIFLTKR